MIGTGLGGIEGIMIMGMAFSLLGLRFLYAQFYSRVPIFFWVALGIGALTALFLFVTGAAIDQIVRNGRFRR